MQSPTTGGTNSEKILGFRGHSEIPRCGTIEYGQNLKYLMGGGLTHSSYNQLIKRKLIPEKNNLIKSISNECVPSKFNAKDPLELNI